MSPDPFRQALILTGPTGSGKSQLGVELAERLGAEIVSMDSMALYRGMDIGTAKPGPEERGRVKHHLLDVLEPWESASVAWWLAQAAVCCREIESRGKRVLFVGGTALYLKALLHGLFDAPPADLDLRRRLTEEADHQGPLALHRRLAVVDPAAAQRLHPNDVRRVIRALEVWELTGRPISAWQTQWSVSPAESSEAVSSADRCLWLDLPRQELFARIDRRVHHMIASGLVEEVAACRAFPGLSAARPSRPWATRRCSSISKGALLWTGRFSASETAQLSVCQTANHLVPPFVSVPPGCLGIDISHLGFENVVRRGW